MHTENSIFGLSELELKPIIENIACEEVKSFDILNLEHDIKAGFVGISGDKVIATFSYTTLSGQTDIKKVFIKRFYEPDAIREAWHYIALQKVDAPIPKFYGSLNISQADGREIIFLECINPVPDYRPYTEFVMDASRYIPFIRVTARFDAIRPSDEYSAMLSATPPQEIFNHSVEYCINLFDQLWQDANDDKLGEDIKRICTDQACNRIRKLPERLIEIDFSAFDYLVHDCYEPCHTGWRHDTDEMLIFDLAGVALSARFSNAGLWLGEADEVREKCLPRKKLAEIYLGEYFKHGGEPVSLDQFLTETRNLWLCESIWLLDLWRRNIIEGENVYKNLLLHLVKLLIGEGNK